jgi:hypothetical protein
MIKAAQVHMPAIIHTTPKRLVLFGLSIWAAPGGEAAQPAMGRWGTGNIHRLARFRFASA